MDTKTLENLYAKSGDTILASNWNMLVDACIEAISTAQSVDMSIDTLSRDIGNLEQNMTKFDSLWTGNAYASGTNIVLSAPMANYDILMVRIQLQGTQYRMMNFDDGVLKSFREINLADSASSTAINLYEVNVKKTNATTLQIASNKQQNLANGASVWSTPTTDVAAQCITQIWGVKF